MVNDRCCDGEVKHCKLSIVKGFGKTADLRSFVIILHDHYFSWKFTQGSMQSYCWNTIKNKARHQFHSLSKAKRIQNSIKWSQQCLDVIILSRIIFHAWSMNFCKDRRSLLADHRYVSVLGTLIECKNLWFRRKENKSCEHTVQWQIPFLKWPYPLLIQEIYRSRF